MFTIPFKITPPIIAHRGASALAPENTLSAFAKAKALGLNWVEFDVTLSADGELVVIHDDTLKRTTNGQGNVLDYTYTALNGLDAGSWFHADFTGEKIPTLKMVLDFLQEAGLAANIELKEVDDVSRIVQDTLHLLKNYPTIPILISSFSHAILRQIRKYSSDVPLGLLMHQWDSVWQSLSNELNCTSLNVNQRILNQQRVAELKTAGKLLTSYTVNQFTRAEQLFSWGVDAIFSDCPMSLINQMRTMS